MTRWIPRFGGVFVVMLLACSLAFLQIQDAEKELLSCLSSYAAIAVAVFLAVGFIRGHVFSDLRPLFVTAIFFAYIILRALVSPAAYAARPDLYCSLAALSIYGLTAIYLKDSAWRIALVLALLGFAVVHVLASVVQAGLGENLMAFSFLEIIKRSSRGTGLFVNPDHLAGSLEVLGIFGLSIACWSRWPRWSKVVIAYLTAIAYFGLVFTGSRGGYLSTLASLIVFALLSLIVLRAGGTSLFFKAGGGGLLLLAASVLSVWLLIAQSASFGERAQTILTPDQGRLDLWRAAFEQWKLQPLFGTGGGTYLFYGRQFRSAQVQLDPVEVHNDYLHLLAEYGAIGGVGFLLFLVIHLRHAWINFLRLGPRRVAGGSILMSDRLALTIGAFGAVGAYVVHSAVDFNLHVPANALLLAFVFGLLANPGLDQDRGISLVRRGRIPQLVPVALAAVLLWQCLRLFPGEYYAEQAAAALRKENPAAAVDLARTALKYEQQNPSIFFRLGRAQVALAGREETSEARVSLLEQALPAFEKARRLVPLDGNYPMELAFIYDRLGRFPEAEEMYEIARARDPRSDTVQQLYQLHLESWENQKQKDSVR